MKAEIIITGQVMGNFTLKEAIICDEVSKGLFNSFTLKFNSKKEAIKSLADAYRHLIEEEPEMKNRVGGIRYHRGGFLAYDASRAEIITLGVQ